MKTFRKTIQWTHPLNQIKPSSNHKDITSFLLLDVLWKLSTEFAGEPTHKGSADMTDIECTCWRTMAAYLNLVKLWENQSAHIHKIVRICPDNSLSHHFSRDVYGSMGDPGDPSTQRWVSGFSVNRNSTTWVTSAKIMGTLRYVPVVLQSFGHTWPSIWEALTYETKLLEARKSKSCQHRKQERCGLSLKFSDLQNRFVNQHDATCLWGQNPEVANSSFWVRDFPRIMNTSPDHDFSHLKIWTLTSQME